VSFRSRLSAMLVTVLDRYAGHYVPTLAKAILDHNSKSPFTLNLQGFAVGNPLTNEVVRAPLRCLHLPSLLHLFLSLLSQDDFNAPMAYYLNHNMLSPAQYAAALAACKGDFSPFSPDQKCQDAMALSQKLLGQIDPYDIFNGMCPTGREILQQINVAFRYLPQ
jgi:serine carboxypeptidase-like clade 2